MNGTANLEPQEGGNGCLKSSFGGREAHHREEEKIRTTKEEYKAVFRTPWNGWEF